MPDIISNLNAESSLPKSEANLSVLSQLSEMRGRIQGLEQRLDARSVATVPASGHVVASVPVQSGNSTMPWMKEWSPSPAIPTPSMADHFEVARVVQDAIRETAVHLERTFVTASTAKLIAKEAVPPSLRGLDKQPGSGGVLTNVGGNAAWTGMPFGAGGGGGITAKGTIMLYSVIAAREYTSSGVLVPAGSETGGEGTSLQPTWDYVRAHA